MTHLATELLWLSRYATEGITLRLLIDADASLVNSFDAS